MSVPSSQVHAAIDNAVSIATALESFENTTRAKSGGKFELKANDLRALAPQLPGWPFAPDDPRAKDLLKWFAGQTVHSFDTYDLREAVLRAIRDAYRNAIIKAVRDRYVVPAFQFTGDPEAHAEYLATCADRQKAADDAVRAATASSPFPERPWLRLIDDALTNVAVETYEGTYSAFGLGSPIPAVVTGFLREGEPAVIGGPLKTCKTNVSIELAAALTTGTPFLGMAVVSPVRCWVLTRETPAPLWLERYELAVRSRGGDPVQAIERLMLTTSLEAVRDTDCRNELRAYLSATRTRVAILDPLYRIRPACSAADIAAEGRALEELALPFTNADCAPVFVHHFVKNCPVGVPPTLDDLTGAGVGPFVRSWLLLGRATEYAFGGVHDLTATIGNSHGDASQTRIRFDEKTWKMDATPMAGAAGKPSKPAYLTDSPSRRTRKG
jgi:hypothetical protein